MMCRVADDAGSAEEFGILGMEDSRRYFGLFDESVLKSGSPQPGVATLSYMRQSAHGPRGFWEF